MTTNLGGEKRAYAYYQVALKILLRRGNEVLFLRVPEGKLDLPGGRIDSVEGEVPLMEILAREVREELGSAVRYRVEGPLFQFRRDTEGEAGATYNFITVYGGEFLGGDIHLSPEHIGFTWLNLKDVASLQEQDFFTPEEFRITTEYFSGHSIQTRQGGGFIQLILLIVIALIVLGFFGYNLRDIVDTPAVRGNLQYVWDIIVSIWNTVIVTPALWLWDKIQTLLPARQ